MKTDILDFFYEHTAEFDWHEGLDLYTTGKVKEVQHIHGLITGKVTSNIGRDLEVRLKVHPNGRFIQWIECTCRKNRTTGQYCEHISALMICLQHDHGKFLAQIDSKMPVKAPTVPRKVRSAQKKEEPEPAKQDGAAQSILSHLKNIHSIRLMAKGPTIRVRAETKPGEFKNYTFQLDEAAKFLASSPKLKSATDEVKQLKVYQTPVTLGTRIYQIEDEKIVAEKVIAIKHTARTLKSLGQVDTSISNQTGLHKLVNQENPNGKEGTFEFIPIKSAGRYIGKEYFFYPQRGYWKLNLADVHGDWHELPLKKTFKDDQAADLVDRGFQEYLEYGPIWLDENLKSHQIDSTPELSQIKIHKSTDGWFYLDPSYGQGKSSVSMVDLMVQFRKNQRDYLKKGDKWVKVPEFIKEHNWDLDDTGKYLKVDSLGLLRLKAAVGDFDQFVGSKAMLNKIRSSLEFQPVGKLPSLKHTNLDLREYQETGLQWMWWLYQNNLHGLLADEMGLGKTHQSMALMSAIQKIKPDARFLVICPTTVLDHWEDKVNDFCPNLKPMKHHGPKRSHNFKIFEKNHALLITSYGVLLRDLKNLTQSEWDAVILDEAHFVKNNDTATYRAVCKLQGRIRLCLTGTPMENHLGELKNIFDFLVPGYLGSDSYFKSHYISPIEKGNASETELELQKLIHPFKMRRNKSNVLKDLPPKVEDIRHCTLSPEQVKIYKKVLSMKGRPLIEQLKNESSPVPYLHVFATLTLLKQVCNHPALVEKTLDYKSSESGKFELLKEILEEAIGSGHKVVIYSQYVQMIKIISQYLTDEDVGHVTLTGSTRNRGAVINKFQTQEDCKVFVGSLLAGGVGIDLTAASVVVHYDRWWNASKENQATDRVYRMGQNKNVQVLKLVNRGTLEEKIDALINSKNELFEKFMDKDEEIFKSLSRNQLIDLLQ
ncbi:DEAD/DEAH box helicase [Pseudobacteriovorax antillogorgiicola]|uniref:DEAD/DEAH box helicase n=1 Tax=Pseudobacteriovorax antillogorgiicola TaxID=1513793 RepID=UPI0013564F9E|nr:DEAD/DEAH box helicase [Pseudobacteriovorax antillogorgiicola]